MWASMSLSTTAHKSYDGRFSPQQQGMGRAGQHPERNVGRMTFRTDWVVDSHPAILDGFVTMFQEELDAQEELEWGSL